MTVHIVLKMRCNVVQTNWDHKQIKNNNNSSYAHQSLHKIQKVELILFFQRQLHSSANYNKDINFKFSKAMQG